MQVCGPNVAEKCWLVNEVLLSSLGGAELNIMIERSKIYFMVTKKYFFKPCSSKGF